MITAEEVIAQFVKPEWKDVATLVKSAAELQERNRCLRIVDSFYVVEESEEDLLRTISQAILDNPQEQ